MGIDIFLGKPSKRVETWIKQKHTFTQLILTTGEIVEVSADSDGQLTQDIIRNSVDHTLIQSVIIGYEVLKIGKRAFAYCTALVDVTMYNTVTDIGPYAFEQCTQLESIEIPDSVQDLAVLAFPGCINLPTYENGIRYESKKKVVLISVPPEYSGHFVVPNTVRFIQAHAFQSCTQLNSVEIPDTVQEIGPDAFNGCTNLTHVQLPKNITTISTAMFLGCINLKTVLLPNTIKTIYQYAFKDCSGLTSIEIPDGVISICYSAFENCTNLSSIAIPRGVTLIEQKTFSGCTKLVQMDFTHHDWPPRISQVQTLPYDNENFVIYIKAGTLDAWKATSGWSEIIDVFEEVEPEPVPEHTIITYIDSSGTSVTQEVECFDGILTWNLIKGKENQFTANTVIKQVVIGQDVKQIGEFAFYDCLELNYVMIPVGVTTIDRFAFHGCSSLTNIIIPDGVTALGQSTFEGCTMLRNISLPPSISAIGQNAFFGCRILNGVYITDIASWCNIEFDYTASNPLFYAHALYLNNILITNLVIPSNVTTVNTYAFRHCTYLTSVTLSDGVVHIGDSVFYNCPHLASVTIPASVETIGHSVFDTCESLTNIILENRTIEAAQALIGTTNNIGYTGTITYNDGTYLTTHTDN